MKFTRKSPDYLAGDSDWLERLFLCPRYISLLLLLCMAAIAQSAPGKPDFQLYPTVDQVNDAYYVEFTLSDYADIEVAIVDPRGKVIRHLAAGMLGPKAPLPLKKNSLHQRIKWDGKDDFRRLPGDVSLYRFRIRVGMGVQLANIAGGDPYAFYSRAMGQGDHAAWAITGLEAKPDGTTYLIGNANNYGPVALRAYSAQGEYKRTVYPPPAGKDADAMRGWGLRSEAGETYTFIYRDLDTPSPGTTLISGSRAHAATIVPSVGTQSLLLLGANHQILSVNSDGTIPESPRTTSALIGDPPVPEKKTPQQRNAPIFTSPSPDGRYFYVTGMIEDSKTKKGTVVPQKFWREGRVFKINAETGEAAIFHSLDENTLVTAPKARNASPIRDSRTTRYATFHGITVDRQNRVFVCDRLNKRVLVLDAQGVIIREIPVEFPDAIAVDANSRALYVTTRYGDFHRRGELRLLKFDDWREQTAPSENLLLMEDVGMYPQPSFLAVSHSGQQAFVWVAYTELPARVYKPVTSGLELVKDFAASAWQQSLDMQHLAVDKRNDEVFIHDGWGNCFLIASWKNPHFEQCRTDAIKTLAANEKSKQKRKSRKNRHNTGAFLGFAIDPLNEYYYLRAPFGEVGRFVRDGMSFLPQISNTSASGHVMTPSMSNDWRINMGFGERGMAAGPDGGIAILASTEKNQYKGPLTYYPPSNAANKKPVLFTDFGETPRSAGVRFDPAGNLYAGKLDDSGKAAKRPEYDDMLDRSTGKIYKYQPTGSLAGGVLFPVAPQKPDKIYDVEFGAISPVFARTPFFDVDGYGRIYYPSSLLSRVSVIDNEGNQIISFGSWGNRDSMGRLAPGANASEDIPLAYPSSIGVTDDYIYVSDLVNIRVLRLKKTFALEVSAGLKTMGSASIPGNSGKP